MKEGRKRSGTVDERLRAFGGAGHNNLRSWANPLEFTVPHQRVRSARGRGPDDSSDSGFHHFLALNNVGFRFLEMPALFPGDGIAGYVSREETTTAE